MSVELEVHKKSKNGKEEVEVELKIHEKEYEDSEFQDPYDAMKDKGHECVVVGTESGSSPTWAAGWTMLPVLTYGSDFAGSAYQVLSAVGTFAAAGTIGRATATWMASAATYAGTGTTPTPTPTRTEP